MTIIAPPVGQHDGIQFFHLIRKLLGAYERPHVQVEQENRGASHQDDSEQDGPNGSLENLFDNDGRLGQQEDNDESTKTDVGLMNHGVPLAQHCPTPVGAR